MEEFKKIVVDASTGVYFEKPLTVGEIAQLDRDRKESEEFINSITAREEKINKIKNKLLMGEKLTEEEFKTLFGE